MNDAFQKIVFTPSVLAAQRQYYERCSALSDTPQHNPLTDEERAFIQGRDSFYITPRYTAIEVEQVVASLRQ